MFNRILIFVVILIIYALSGCANYGSITGGEKDENPPQVITEKSTPNFQVNYTPKKIQLAFDEWVKLNNPGQNIVVSPILNKRLRFKLRGRNVETIIDTSYHFAPNTTYQIQFIDAIQDITESNPLVNYKFVFSTGAHLDSAIITGEVAMLDPETKIKDAKAQLYKEWLDTSFIAQVPQYISEINKDSLKFRFDYLPVDSFYLVVTSDDNDNGVYEKGIDYIGFYPQPILSEDSISLEPIRLFKETIPLNILELDTSFRHQAIWNWNFVPRNLVLNCDDCVQITEGSSVKLFNSKRTYPWQIYLYEEAEDFRDTIIVHSPEGKENVDVTIDNVRTQDRFDLGDSMKIYINQPIDTSSIALQFVIDKDTTLSTVETKLGENFITLPHVLTEVDTTLFVEIPSQKIKGIQGYNRDTLTFQWRQSSKKNQGNLILKINGLDSLSHYVILCKDKSSELVYETISEKSDFEKTFVMKAGKYRLELIEDVNKNGRWDSGHPEQFSNSEPIYFYDIPEIRANWDTDFEIILE